MSDFSKYGGPSEEWLAVQATLPAPPTNQQMLEGKRVVNEGREAISAKDMEVLASKIRTKDFQVPTRDGSFVEARRYRPITVSASQALPVYIHLHGGGYLYGTLSSEDAICSRIACGAGVVVLNINYRHTPEHVYPTAWNDVEDAFEWAHAHMKDLGGNGQEVVVGGISAGAQLAASLTLRQHLKQTRGAIESCPAIAGQVLMIPCLAHVACYKPQLERLKDASLSSYNENEHAPILPLKTARFFTELLKVENPQVNDTRLNPGNATSAQVKGLPSTVFGIAGLDPLRDEGLLYAELLTETGLVESPAIDIGEEAYFAHRVPTDVNLFRGVPHGFRRFGDKLSASARWDEVMEKGIRWALGKPSSSESFIIKT
ncbi:hypothetical protein AK830_g4211 [Neonectria ditissima]|uniref:Alpha/beta hydrolase fold-3 domain-containing protein n=1 Tax=Neonectria ditissima TaxID=78410 RepID=A0A0P7BNX5_9HYPO|nr:hypothetical protein AK830_g4211 [Neonectria ditissima]